MLRIFIILIIGSCLSLSYATQDNLLDKANGRSKGIDSRDDSPE